MKWNKIVTQENRQREKKRGVTAISTKNRLRPLNQNNIN